MLDSSSAAQVPKACLKLEGCQDVRNATALQKSLSELLATGDAVTIDCSAIESLDAACVQLLVAAKREAQESLQIIAPADSEAGRWFQTAGVHPLLMGIA